ncbi:tetratricopeptide repeat protein [Sphaerothrix gracilis]|uniref:tetratricopeptide repeat protein n=1 Tax=Sphaerothrix gracilis TaxID=3151835 RepID=UPI0031FBF0FE
MSFLGQASWLVRTIISGCLLAIALTILPAYADAPYMNSHGKRIPSFEYPYYISPERTEAETYLNEGLEKAYQGDREGAIAGLTQAIATDSTYEMAYRYLGDIYRETDQLSLALDAYSHALEYNPFFARLYNSRGEVLMTLGQYEEAIDDFSKAMEVYPEDPVGYYNRGKAYADLKNYPQAIFDLRDAIRISDIYVDAYVGRGEVRQAVDNLQGAIADYRTAAELLKEEADSQADQGETTQSQQLLQQYQALADKAEALAANLS